MSETFAATARRCHAIAVRLLGWRPDEFWRATPAELAMALADPDGAGAAAPPTRQEIARMMERDENARPI